MKRREVEGRKRMWYTCDPTDFMFPVTSHGTYICYLSSTILSPKKKSLAFSIFLVVIEV